MSAEKNLDNIISPIDTININIRRIPNRERRWREVKMFIKLKDFVSSSRRSISALSADIIQKRHHISTKSADMTTLGEIGKIY